MKKNPARAPRVAAPLRKIRRGVGAPLPIEGQLLYDSMKGKFYDATGADVTADTLTAIMAKHGTPRPGRFDLIFDIATDPTAPAAERLRAIEMLADFQSPKTRRDDDDPYLGAAVFANDAIDKTKHAQKDRPTMKSSALAALYEQDASNVNHPAHYNQGEVECIDAIRSQMTPAQFKGFLRGQIAKYNWRLEAKGDPEENLGKLRWYLDQLDVELRTDRRMAEE